jgi:xanthine dehydrogenase accessory factor
MTDALLEELLRARKTRTPCVLATMAATTGSVPRDAGSKMIVYGDGKVSATIGGGKFEAIVVEDCLAALRAKKPLLKTYPLHESSPESFGAICGGEATVLIEPQNLNEAVYLIGGGHVAHAIAQLASQAGMFVSVIEDRAERFENLPSAVQRIADVTPAAFIASREWQSDEALVVVSRNYEIDRDALMAAVEQTAAGYVGMIGSTRKVRRVLEHLRESGVSEEKLARVYAPIGLDIGAESPAEIAVSVLAEILLVLRGGAGSHLRLSSR